MKEAHQRLLAAYNNMRRATWFIRHLRPFKYGWLYRQMIDAIRESSGWLDHGNGTDKERAELYVDQLKVEEYMRSFGLRWNHPWNKGNG